MTIAQAILEATKYMPDGYPIHAGEICDRANAILQRRGDKKVSESSIKRKMRRLKVCFSINNTPNHPSDMRIMDRTGARREAYNYGKN